MSSSRPATPKSPHSINNTDSAAHSTSEVPPTITEMDTTGGAASQPQAGVVPTLPPAPLAPIQEESTDNNATDNGPPTTTIVARPREGSIVDGGARGKGYLPNNPNSTTVMYSPPCAAASAAHRHESFASNDSRSNLPTSSQRHGLRERTFSSARGRGRSIGGGGGRGAGGSSSQSAADNKHSNRLGTNNGGAGEGGAASSFLFGIRSRLATAMRNPMPQVSTVHDLPQGVPYVDVFRMRPTDEQEYVYNLSAAVERERDEKYFIGRGGVMGKAAAMCDGTAADDEANLLPTPKQNRSAFLEQIRLEHRRAKLKGQRYGTSTGLLYDSEEEGGDEEGGADKERDGSVYSSDDGGCCCGGGDKRVSKKRGGRSNADDGDCGCCTIRQCARPFALAAVWLENLCCFGDKLCCQYNVIPLAGEFTHGNCRSPLLIGLILSLSTLWFLGQNSSTLVQATPDDPTDGQVFIYAVQWLLPLGGMYATVKGSGWFAFLLAVATSAICMYAAVDQLYTDDDVDWYRAKYTGLCLALASAQMLFVGVIGIQQLGKLIKVRCCGLGDEVLGCVDGEDEAVERFLYSRRIINWRPPLSVGHWKLRLQRERKDPGRYNHHNVAFRFINAITDVPISMFKMPVKLDWALPTQSPDGDTRPLDKIPTMYNVGLSITCVLVTTSLILFFLLVNKYKSTVHKYFDKKSDKNDPDLSKQIDEIMSYFDIFTAVSLALMFIIMAGVILLQVSSMMRIVTNVRKGGCNGESSDSPKKKNEQLRDAGPHKLVDAVPTMFFTFCIFMALSGLIAPVIAGAGIILWVAPSMLAWDFITTVAEFIWRFVLNNVIIVAIQWIFFSRFLTDAHNLRHPRLFAMLAPILVLAQMVVSFARIILRFLNSLSSIPLLFVMPFSYSNSPLHDPLMAIVFLNDDANNSLKSVMAAYWAARGEVQKISFLGENFGLNSGSLFATDGVMRYRKAFEHTAAANTRNTNSMETRDADHNTIDESSSHARLLGTSAADGSAGTNGDDFVSVEPTYGMGRREGVANGGTSATEPSGAPTTAGPSGYGTTPPGPVGSSGVAASVTTKHDTNARNTMYVTLSAFGAHELYAMTKHLMRLWVLYDHFPQCFPRSRTPAASLHPTLDRTVRAEIHAYISWVLADRRGAENNKSSNRSASGGRSGAHPHQTPSGSPQTTRSQKAGGAATISALSGATVEMGEHEGPPRRYIDPTIESIWLDDLTRNPNSKRVYSRGVIDAICEAHGLLVGDDGDDTVGATSAVGDGEGADRTPMPYSHLAEVIAQSSLGRDRRVDGEKIVGAPQTAAAGDNNSPLDGTAPPCNPDDATGTTTRAPSAALLSHHADNAEGEAIHSPSEATKPTTVATKPVPHHQLSFAEQAALFRQRTEEKKLRRREARRAEAIASLYEEALFYFYTVLEQQHQKRLGILRKEEAVKRLWLIHCLEHPDEVVIPLHVWGGFVNYGGVGTPTAAEAPPGACEVASSTAPISIAQLLQRPGRLLGGSSLISIDPYAGRTISYQRACWRWRLAVTLLLFPSLKRERKHYLRRNGFTPAEPLPFDPTGL